MTDIKCGECGEAIEDGGSASLTVHDFCCSHERVADVEREHGMLFAHCEDCGSNVMDAGDDGSWELVALNF